MCCTSDSGGRNKDWDLERRTAARWDPPVEIRWPRRELGGSVDARAFSEEMLYPTPTLQRIFRPEARLALYFCR